MGRRGGGEWWIARRGDETRYLSVFERAVVALVFGGRTKLFVEESAEATGRYSACCFYQVSTAISNSNCEAQNLSISIQVWVLFFSRRPEMFYGVNKEIKLADNIPTPTDSINLNS